MRRYAVGRIVTDVSKELNLHEHYRENLSCRNFTSNFDDALA
jgi:hypothetical protein